MEGQSYLTREGYEKLKKEYDILISTRRREIAHDIETARLKGDLRENAEYDAAKEAQAHLEKKIVELENVLSHVNIIDDVDIPLDRVCIGTTVYLKDHKTKDEFKYTMVSESESDLSQNRIAITSPIGKGLVSRKVGEIAEIKIPAGILKYEIIKIARE